MHIPILILAAGASARMRGRDKLLEQVEGDPLLRVMAQRARNATQGDVLVALPPMADNRRAALKGLNVQIVQVDEANEGINASIRTGVAALSDRADAVMILLADLPELQSEDLAQVLAAVSQDPDALIWRATTQDKRPGHPIVFANALFGALRQLQGDDGARAVVQDHFDQQHLVPLPGDRARLDLDTPEAWEEWRFAQ